MPAKSKKAVVQPEVLPYLRAALAGLFAQQRGNHDLYAASDQTAQVLLAGLARHGLIIQPLKVVGKKQAGRPRAPAGAAAAAEPRRIYYTQAETNKLVKQALRRAWPKVAFFLRSSFGCTDVYYWEVGAAPTCQQVKAITDRFEGAVPNNCDGRDARLWPRTGLDGQPELVRYGADYITVCPVTQRGERSFRTDGRTHFSTISDLSLCASLTRAQPKEPGGRGKKS